VAVCLLLTNKENDEKQANINNWNLIGTGIWVNYFYIRKDKKGPDVAKTGQNCRGRIRNSRRYSFSVKKPMD